MKSYDHSVGSFPPFGSYSSGDQSSAPGYEEALKYLAVARSVVHSISRSEAAPIVAIQPVPGAVGPFPPHFHVVLMRDMVMQNHNYQTGHHNNLLSASGRGAALTNQSGGEEDNKSGRTEGIRQMFSFLGHLVMGIPGVVSGVIGCSWGGGKA